jgi:Methyltransferase domain
MKTEEIASDGDSRSIHCPACGKKNLGKGTAAVISPWVLELSKERHIPNPRYKICTYCSSSWFNKSYSQTVLDSLYIAYRGKEYFRIRNSWEPTYTENLNSGLNSGEEWLNGRRRQILESLESAGADPSNMKSVLDFGGGHGGVMPRFPKRYLLEANESVVPEHGIELIHEWQDARNLSLDLVMCCGVLEHLNDPQALVRTMLDLDAEIYLFEVPTGIPINRKGLSANSLLLQIFRSNRLIWRTIQRIERRLGRSWLAYFPLRCSEHLQFFSQAGLFRLLDQSGFEVLEIKQTYPNKSLTDRENLGFEIGLIAICRKKP